MVNEKDLKVDALVHSLYGCLIQLKSIRLQSRSDAFDTDFLDGVIDSLSKGIDYIRSL